MVSQYEQLVTASGPLMMPTAMSEVRMQQSVMYCCTLCSNIGGLSCTLVPCAADTSVLFCTAFTAPTEECPASAARHTVIG